MSFKYPAIFISLLFISCSTNKITGLWVVENVQVGTETMTPSARWMEFRKDKTQRSGNGWQQHSIGTWSFDTSTEKLHVDNTNGYSDPNGPFAVSFENGNMIWEREEEGQAVLVTLSRADELPPFHGDKLLGVWDLFSVTENGNDITRSYDPTDKRYLFFRWDNVYNNRYTPGGNISGTYKVHGHKPEVEMIAYGNECEREWWSFEVTAEMLVLKSVNSETEIVKRYNRIRHFPE